VTGATGGPATGATGGPATGAIGGAAVPERLLLGAGPSIVPERVLAALREPTIGHLDPAFLAIMDDTAELLRAVMGTANRATLPLPATGSGGMEATVANFVDAGDRVVCGVNGQFGARMADALARQGAEVVRVEAEWGRAIPTERLIEALSGGAAALFVVHGETSTGVCQPLAGLADACRERDALFLLDCVTSLSGQRLALDQAGVDAAFAGTQKCLNCPPGLAPFTAGERALAKLRARTAPGRSWYFDLNLLLGYWSALEDGGAQPRAYHHTAPVNMVYALREALRLALEEDLEQRWERHRRAHEALLAALGQLGAVRLARAEEVLWPLLAVRPPQGVDEAAVRRALLVEHGIEISGGLGPLAGRLWRVGVMGVGALPDPQRRLVRALAAALGRDPVDALGALEQGWAVV
jgi:alanine-glyoxylate transaminase/serine-glyoxylate transaminase/serine-pyruvate transaminase